MVGFACMHHRSLCRPWSRTNLADITAPFFCCYVVEELLVRSLVFMFKAHPTSRTAEVRFMRRIGRRLRYLPHSIQLKPYPGGILVSWEDNETESVRRLGPGGLDCFMRTTVRTLGRHFSTMKQVSGRNYAGKTADSLAQPSLSTWCPVAAASNLLARHTECASLPVCLTYLYIML
jgi:hypothetical protein